MLLTLALLLPIQDPPLPPTVVTALRSKEPATSTATGRVVATGEELRATGERSLPRAIGRATGVWVQETNLGGGAPFIRGLAGNQVLVVVDGIRLNDSTTRYGPNQSLNTIDPMIVERVEVIRGPSSVLYGSDALGGVILIWTRRRAPGSQGGETGRGLEIDPSYSSVAEGYRGSMTAGAAGEQLGALVSGSFQDWGNLRAGGDEEQEHTGYHGGALFGSLDVALGEERSLRTTVRGNKDIEVPRTDKMTVGYGQTEPSHQLYHYKLQERRALAMTYSDGASGLIGDEMQVRLWYRTYEEEREKIRTGAQTRVWERDEVGTLGLGVDWRSQLGDDHLLTYGIDLQNDEVDSVGSRKDINTGVVTPGEGEFAPDSRYTSMGIFVQDEIFTFEPIDLTAGLRYSLFDFGFDDFPSQGTGSESGGFDALTASVQAARDVSEGVRLTAGVAQGFRAPNLDDLARDGTFGSGTELHNPDLEPERSLTAELAVEVVRPVWDFALSIFNSDIQDLIGRVLVDPTPGNLTFLRENVGRAQMFGAEALYHQRLGKEEDSPYALEIGAAWVRGQQWDDTEDPPGSGEQPLHNVPMRRVPPFHGHVALNWEPAQSRYGFVGWGRIEWVFAARQGRLHPYDVLDPRIDPDGTDGWQVVNLDVGGPIGELGDGSTWTVGIHNVLDEEYRVHGSGFDAPGRGVVVGLHLAF